MAVNGVPSGIQEYGKKKEEKEKGPKHEIEDILSAEPIWKPYKDPREENRCGEHNPHLDKWNVLSTRILGRDNKGIFKTPQNIVVKC